MSGEQLRRVLDGLDGDGQPLRESSSPVKVAGYDLTFSAPKSVSVLFGLGEPEVREAVRQAHDKAVAAAMGHLERTAAAVRRGHGGLIVEPASGLVVGLFRHRTSRVGDPQLHTHAVVANLGKGPDGRWSTLDGRPDLRAGADGELRLSGRAALGAVAGVGGGVDAGAQGDRRDRRRAQAGAAGVQPAPGGDRGRARASRHVGPGGQ